MAEQPRGAVDDREPEPEARRPVPLRAARLVELLEDARLVGARASQALAADARETLGEQAASAYRPLVFSAIAGLVLSGTYNILSNPGHSPSYHMLLGIKLLLVQPLTPQREPAGRPLVAVDSVGAGVGEEVFFVRGKEASFPFYPAEPPVDAGIVGIVDHWDLG